MDEGLTSALTVKEAKELILKAQQLCNSAGLHLQKFNVNQKDALSSVSPSKRTVITKVGDQLGLCPDVTLEGHILGIQWLIEKDNFTFNVDAKDHPPSDRDLVSVVASLYNALIFLDPFTLSGRNCVVEASNRMIQFLRTALTVEERSSGVNESQVTQMLP